MPKPNDLQNLLRILVKEDDIGGSEVEVDDVAAVYEAEAGQDLPHEELALLLSQTGTGRRTIARTENHLRGTQ